MTGLDPGLVALLAPLVVLEIGLALWALWDLTRPGRRVRGESRLMWGVIILLISLIGPILYFVVGRQEGTAEPEPRSWPTATPPAAEPMPPPATTRPDAPGPAGPTVAPTSSATAPRSGPVAITCHGLTKRYPGGVLALDRLDLEVPAGSVFGLLGPNGAGKTTTLRLLVGLARPSGGSASVAGIPLGTAELTERIGFLDQDPRYYDWSTGRELVELVGQLHGLTGQALHARVDEVLGQVGLAEAADRRIGTYSGGMRQRLGIAQALVDRPPVLILDEPVSSLDPEGRRDLLALISELR
ncbi:MAG: ATP-binding cassette domain-containing protein, partial [Candidatus Limnocylindrales bacterium]